MQSNGRIPYDLRTAICEADSAWRCYPYLSQGRVHYKAMEGYIITCQGDDLRTAICEADSAWRCYPYLSQGRVHYKAMEGYIITCQGDNLRTAICEADFARRCYPIPYDLRTAFAKRILMAVLPQEHKEGSIAPPFFTVHSQMYLT